jgi:hypothetical protein
VITAVGVPTVFGKQRLGEGSVCALAKPVSAVLSNYLQFRHVFQPRPLDPYLRIRALTSVAPDDRFGEFALLGRRRFVRLFGREE